MDATSLKKRRPGEGPDSLLARQLGRLIEDFLECDEAGRFEIAALAQELAEERLRRGGRPAKKQELPS